MLSIYRKNATDIELITLDEAMPGAWINLVNPTKDEISKISEIVNVEKDAFYVALEDDEKPRIEVETGYKNIIVRAPISNTQTKISVFPLSIIVTSKYIITVSLKENEILKDFFTGVIKHFFTTKRTRFTLQILSRINYHAQKYLAEIEKKIENIEKTLLKSSRNEEIIELLGIQKSMVFLNTAVVANDKVLERIYKGNILKFFNDDEDLVNDIIIENKESIEMVNIYSNILSNTMDSYASIISNNLNRVMKFLASVTIIVAIPTIVASIYGMNVALPFQSSPNAFMYTMIISLICSIFVSFLFMKKGYF